MRKGRNGGETGEKNRGKKKEIRMKIVATTSLPAVDRPNAARLCQFYYGGWVGSASYRFSIIFFLKKNSFKHLILPKKHFKTNLSVSIFGGRDPPQPQSCLCTFAPLHHWIGTFGTLVVGGGC